MGGNNTILPLNSTLTNKDDFTIIYALFQNHLFLSNLEKFINSFIIKQNNKTSEYSPMDYAMIIRDLSIEIHYFLKLSKIVMNEKIMTIILSIGLFHQRLKEHPYYIYLKEVKANKKKFKEVTEKIAIVNEKIQNLGENEHLSNEKEILLKELIELNLSLDNNVEQDVKRKLKTKKIKFIKNYIEEHCIDLDEDLSHLSLSEDFFAIEKAVQLKLNDLFSNEENISLEEIEIKNIFSVTAKLLEVTKNKFIAKNEGNLVYTYTSENLLLSEEEKFNSRQEDLYPQKEDMYEDVFTQIIQDLHEEINQALSLPSNIVYEKDFSQAILVANSIILKLASFIKESLLKTKYQAEVNFAVYLIEEIKYAFGLNNNFHIKNSGFDIIKSSEELYGKINNYLSTLNPKNRFYHFLQRSLNNLDILLKYDDSVDNLMMEEYQNVRFMFYVQQLKYEYTIGNKTIMREDILKHLQEIEGYYKNNKQLSKELSDQLAIIYRDTMEHKFKVSTNQIEWEKVEPPEIKLAAEAKKAEKVESRIKTKQEPSAKSGVFGVISSFFNNIRNKKGVPNIEVSTDEEDTAFTQGIGPIADLPSFGILALNQHLSKPVKKNKGVKVNPDKPRQCFPSV